MVFARVTALLLAALLAAAQALAAGVRLEDHTWTELRDAIRAGTTTIIIPIGGTEQNGPHMALGKHNVRVAALAERIAVRLGKALVAPVLAYAPEGRISPPTGHMRFPGTISIPEDALTAVLEGAVRSFRQHGFRDIVLLGDSGDYQPLLRQLSLRLNAEWSASATRVHHLDAYYLAATTGFAQLLRERGVSPAQIGIHAGLADTSLMMAIDASKVRAPLLGTPEAASPLSGVTGDPARASADFGQAGVELIVEKSAAAIREAIALRR